ncbi:MAG TPA: glycosyltransferase family 2 protein [Opitutaceae bacterium]|nr:glycosyltransferase family 2 protein [Opitutaceae bacterium]
MTAETGRLSVVVAAFNEEGNLPVLYERLRALDWKALRLEPEFLFVDDHSRDRTAEVLAALAAADPRVKVLRLSRNFGSHKAFTAGLEHCSGDGAVILAADLQDPPETIPQLIGKWRNGARVVWATRDARQGESLATKLLSRLYYFLMRRFAEVEPPRKGADFLLLDRRVIDELRAAPEKNTSLLSLIQWMGFEQAEITYTKAARHSGRSSWTMSKKLKLAVDSFVSFSYAPMRFASACGLLFAFSGFLYAAVIATRAIAFGSPVQGWASMMCVLLIVSGVQLVMLGILGEYLWRTFDETRGRPRYIVEKRINL